MSDGSGKMRRRQLAAKLGNVHRHYVGSTSRIDKGHFLVRFGVIDIVGVTMIRSSFTRLMVSFSRVTVVAGVLLVCCCRGCFQFLQHPGNA